ncbi:hypothetical protein [Rathayibacter sp. VKM Ac-2760]|uniref:hypothetical protein n=1 Tax=Rathayibacter sp. VKM Ac-2760 TaxID=2609253 RepID=UPI001316F447|nr:hypothetical protein [Rathayibacter sp. VKM Ac-2760]QHC60498.1 hypothetical protein GSU72_19500 [Rathayibacter sp. VKM Ac-2760]
MIGGRARSAIIGIALLVAAAIVTVTAPTDDDVQSPLAVRGTLGETVQSRLVAVTVHDVALARELTFDGELDPPSSTPGVWVVVDLTAVCRMDACSFGRSELRLGERVFAPATLAPPPSFVQQGASPGLPYRQSALFEVPLDAIESGEAELTVQPSTTRALESVAVVELALPDSIDATAPAERARLVETGS